MCFSLEKFLLNFMRCTINIHHSELSRCNCSFNICNQVVGVYGMSKQLPYSQPDARWASKCTTLYWIGLKKCHGCIFSTVGFSIVSWAATKYHICLFLFLCVVDWVSSTSLVLSKLCCYMPLTRYKLFTLRPAPISTEIPNQSLSGTPFAVLL